MHPVRHLPEALPLRRNRSGQAGAWTIDRFRCVQCGSCVRECPKDCLTMEPTYTPPATSKHVDSFEVPETKKTA